MAVRNAGPQPFAPWSPSAQARHGGRRSRLVDEDEPLWVEVELALEPGWRRFRTSGRSCSAAWADFF